MVAAEDPVGEAARIVDEHRAARRSLPGFGHHLHLPDDPRTPRIFALAREHGLAGAYIAAIETLSAALDRAVGRHLTINATGAVAAALRDADVPAAIMRGFALIARCAGLVGHLHEEQQRPVMSTIWEAAERAVPYQSGQPKPTGR
jgi:citrate synthase